MSWKTELQSWMSPSKIATSGAPTVGQQAPTSAKLTIPRSDGKPVVVTFLRHCGCPFAEKTFLNLRIVAMKHTDAHFIAVSHSDKLSTDRWLNSLPDPSANEHSSLEIVVDAGREIYAAWGLGVSSFWHVLSPGGLYAVYRLGKEDGIWNRPTESGSRWQTSGSFAVDGEGIVQWSRPSGSADDIPNFEEALHALAVGGSASEGHL